jgi:hypothetical protein
VAVVPLSAHALFAVAVSVLYVELDEIEKAAGALMLVIAITEADHGPI